MMRSVCALSQGLPHLLWMRGGLQMAPTTVEYSPNELYVESTESDGLSGTAKLWRTVPDGILVHTLGDATCAVFTADGSALVGGNGRSATVWSVPSGQVLRTVEGLPAKIVSLAANGSNFAAGLDNGDIEIVNFQTGVIAATLHGDGAAINAIAWSPDGHWIASLNNAYYADIHIWHTDTDSLVFDLPNQAPTHTACLTFSVDSSTLYIPSTDYGWTTLVYLDWASGWYGPTGGGSVGQNVLCLSSCPLSPGSQVTKLAVGSAFNGGASATVYPPGTNFSLGNAIPCMALSPDSTTLLTGGDNGDNYGIALWSALSKNLGTLIGYLTPPGPGGRNHFLVVSADGSTTAQAAKDHGQLIVRHASDGSIKAVMPELNANAAVLSPDGAVVTYNYGDTIIQRRVEDGAVTWSESASSLGVTWVHTEWQISPDGSRIYVIGSPSTLVLSAADGSLLAKLPGANLSSLSQDGSLIAMDLDQGYECQVLRTSDGAVIQTIDNVSPGAVALSPDASTLVISLNDGYATELAVFDVATGAELRTIPASGDVVDGGIAFRPDGRVLAVSDGALSFFDPASGLKLNADGIETTSEMKLAFSPGGHLLYYGRNDSTVCCLAVPPFHFPIGAGRANLHFVWNRHKQSPVFSGSYGVSRSAPGDAGLFAPPAGIGLPSTVTFSVLTDIAAIFHRPSTLR